MTAKGLTSSKGLTKGLTKGLKLGSLSPFVVPTTLGLLLRQGDQILREFPAKGLNSGKGEPLGMSPVGGGVFLNPENGWTTDRLGGHARKISRQRSTFEFDASNQTNQSWRWQK